MVPDQDTLKAPDSLLSVPTTHKCQSPLTQPQTCSIFLTVLESKTVTVLAFQVSKHLLTIMKRKPLARTSSIERQASLIAAAASLFARKGFNGTTTKEIAKAAGVSEALVFKYFPTKRALYAAILAEKVTINELLDAIEESSRKRDDRQVFSLIAGYRIRPGVDSTLLRLLLFSALEGHELSDMFFGKHHKVFYEHLATYIQTRIEDGAFRAVDPLLAARAFIGMVVHHRLLHEIFGVPMHRSHEETVSAYVDLFLQSLMADPAMHMSRARRSR